MGPIASHASGNTSRARRPSAAGCLSPISSAYATLGTRTNSGPQNNVTGKRVPKARSSALRNAGVHAATGPSGDAAQSTSS